MRGWLVYLTRALGRLLGMRIAQQRLADSRVLVGITFLDPHGRTVEYFQAHGRVILANRTGIVLERTDGRQPVRVAAELAMAEGGAAG
jgi:hypothetical protein